jgi:hypothetical protein
MIGCAGFVPDGKVVNFVTKAEVMDALAPSNTARLRVQAAPANMRSPEQSGFSTRRTCFKAAQKADIDRLASLRTTANAAYAAGECVACAAQISALRLIDRKPDCVAAAVARQ